MAVEWGEGEMVEGWTRQGRTLSVKALAVLCAIAGTAAVLFVPSTTRAAETGYNPNDLPVAS
jgi:hypothetical protein